MSHSHPQFDHGWHVRHRRDGVEPSASWLIYRPPGTGGVLEQMFKADGLPYPEDYIYCESGLLLVGLLATTDLIGLLAPDVVNHPFVRELITNH